jgi:hypothetical protein
MVVLGPNGVFTILKWEISYRLECNNQSIVGKFNAFGKYTVNSGMCSHLVTDMGEVGFFCVQGKPEFGGLPEVKMGDMLLLTQSIQHQYLAVPDFLLLCFLDPVSIPIPAFLNAIPQWAERQCRQRKKVLLLWCSG